MATKKEKKYYPQTVFLNFERVSVSRDNKKILIWISNKNCLSISAKYLEAILNNLNKKAA